MLNGRETTNGCDLEVHSRRPVVASLLHPFLHRAILHDFSQHKFGLIVLLDLFADYLDVVRTSSIEPRICKHVEVVDGSSAGRSSRREDTDSCSKMEMRVVLQLS